MEDSSPTHETTSAQPMSIDSRKRSLLACLGLTLILALCASIDPLASTSFYREVFIPPCAENKANDLFLTASLPQVTAEFHTAQDVANLCSSLDFAGVVTTSVYWSSASRCFNRKKVLLTSLSLVIVFTLIGGFSTSIGELIAFRFLSSASATGIIVTSVSIINDIWPIERKGLGMGIFFIGPQASVTLGPVVGGLLTNRWGWRSLQRFQTCWTAAMTVLVVLFIPAFSAQARQGGDGGSDIIHPSQYPQPQPALIKKMVNAAMRPLRIFGLLRYAFIVVLLYLAAFSYMITSFYLVSLQSLLSDEPYRFSSLEIGLCYLPYAVGSIVASILGGRWSDWVMRRAAIRRKGPSNTFIPPSTPEYRPEDRIQENTWFSFALVPAGLATFGWVFAERPLWVYPLIPSLFMGMAAGMNLSVLTTTLIELIPPLAAGLMALNSVGRNALSTVGGSIAQPLLDAVHVEWLYTGLCVLSSLNLGLLIIVQRNGSRWRATIQEAELRTPA